MSSSQLNISQNSQNYLTSSVRETDEQLRKRVKEMNELNEKLSKQLSMALIALEKGEKIVYGNDMVTEMILQLRDDVREEKRKARFYKEKAARAERDANYYFKRYLELADRCGL